MIFTIEKYCDFEPKYFRDEAKAEMEMLNTLFIAHLCQCKR